MSPKTRANSALMIVLNLSLVLLIGGCDSNSEVLVDPEAQPIAGKLSAPDPSYRLAARERALVRPGFDADAVERLLAHVRPEVRPDLFRFFERLPGGTPGFVTAIGDPELQLILDEIYAPRWRQMPNERLLRSDDLPGRDDELRRRGLREPT